VGAVLEHVAALGRTFAEVKARPFGDVRLSRNQADALFLLAHSRAPVSPGRLADLLGITAGGVTQIVDHLREHGLVEQVPHPTDGRTRILTLTPTARRTVDEFERAVIDHVSPRFDALDDAALDQLEALLRTVREA
jgi:DNA-binding MarR family transcriptional regulator